jgi:hypothetical protein
MSGAGKILGEPTNLHPLTPTSCRGCRLYIASVIFMTPSVLARGGGLALFAHHRMKWPISAW